MGIASLPRQLVQLCLGVLEVGSLGIPNRGCDLPAYRWIRLEALCYLR